MRGEPGGERALPILERRVRGQRDRGGGDAALPELAEEIVAVHLGHADVAHDDGGREGGHDREGRAPALGLPDLGAVRRDEVPDQLAGIEAVLDDQHPEAGERARIADPRGPRGRAASTTAAGGRPRRRRGGTGARRRGRQAWHGAPAAAACRRARTQPRRRRPAG